jgi:hypothetical protein
LQQKEPHAQPPHKPIKSSGVQAVINGEVCNVNNVCNTDPILITCDNETDIFISKSTKDTIWNLEYTGLSLLIRHNVNYQSVKHNLLSVADGRLLMHLTNKPLKVEQIDSIDIWIDAFINNVNVVIDRHPLLAGYLLGYMSIIRGAVVDPPFNRATTNNFDFELHTIKPEHGLKLMTIDCYNLSPKGR